MNARFAGLPIAALLLNAACYRMRQVELDDLGAQRATRVWVTHTNQSVLILHDAQVFRGKLVGFVDGKYQELPAADLHKVHVRELATARTVTLLAAGALAFTVGAVLMSGNEGDFDPCVGDDACDDALRVGF